jgi:hypothetical protein
MTATCRLHYLNSIVPWDATKADSLARQGTEMFSGEDAQAVGLPGDTDEAP